MNAKACLLSLLLTLPWAAAADGLDVRAERDRIAAERADAQAQFAQQEIACRARFAVNDCVARSKARLREMLAALRRQELALDAGERQRKAQERLLDLEQRARPSDAGAVQRER